MNRHTLFLFIALAVCAVFSVGRMVSDALSETRTRVAAEECVRGAISEGRDPTRCPNAATALGRKP